MTFHDMVSSADAGAQEDATEPKTMDSARGTWSDHWSTQDGAWQYVVEAEEDPTKKVTYFKYLQIASDGGLSDITGSKGEDDYLWFPTRYISAFMAVLFLFGNTAYVVHVDTSILFGQKTLHGGDDYLLSSTFMHATNSALRWMFQIFGHQGDDVFSNPAKLIASVELLILMGLWIKVAWSLLVMLSGNSRLDRLRWYAAQNLFFSLIPVIGVYSSLLMLFPAAPKVFIQDLFTCLFYRESKNYYRDLAWLVSSRTICFVIGFDSFLVKFREGANQFIMSTPESDKKQFQLTCFVGAAMLLNQTLGVVQLNWMMKERLFRFVFAGENGIMSSSETVKKDTWNAQIAKKLFTAYTNHVDKFTMLLTFNDDDFQRLTLHEKDDHSTDVIV